MKDYYDFEEYENYYNSRDIKKNRVILHSDLNNFFASVESLYSEELKDVPLAVCGDKEARHGIVLAKNELAKKYGVKTGDTISKAKEKCPSLVTRSCHYGDYVSTSRKVREIYLSFATRVEPFGIDEAWLDVTELSKRENKNDIFKAGFNIANRLREKVKRETGLTVSVGVSFNKTFSKLASDMKKPDAVTLISFNDFKERVWSLPVENLLFVGRKTKSELKRLKIRTIGDLALTKRLSLKNELGKSGETLWDIANGFDFSPVNFYSVSEKQKSVSQSTTMPYDVTTYEEADSVLSALSDTVSANLKKEKIYSSTIKLFVRFSDFTSFVRQVKLSAPTSLSNDIFMSASRLFKANVDFLKPVRAIGVGAEDLRENVGEQLTFIFEDNVENALEKTRKKYGDNVIQRASVLKNSKLCEFDKKHVCFNSGI